MLMQRKVTKRNIPRMARIPPLRFSPVPARAPTRRAHNTRSGLEHGAREGSGTGCDARARHTGALTPTSPDTWEFLRVGFFRPRSARRVPQPEREISSEPLFESSRVLCGRRVGERPLGRGTEGVFARSGATCFFGDFLCTSKESHPGSGAEHPRFK